MILITEQKVVRMDYRIEIAVKPEWHDARGEAALKKINDFLHGDVEKIRTRDVFTVSADITQEQAEKIAAELANPVLQDHRLAHIDDLALSIMHDIDPRRIGQDGQGLLDGFVHDRTFFTY